MTRPLDVLVIGGGQAGLAMGYELTRRRVGVVIVDGSRRMHTRGSALLGWVGRDARFLARRIHDMAGEA